MSRTLDIMSAGWVLPGWIGQGTPAELAAGWRTRVTGPAFVPEFSAKDYLASTKGYLDPSGAYALAALALALRGQPELPKARTGIVSATVYGALQSGWIFYEQMASKGIRLASPMIFPHSYANTPGNLAAIEFGFSGSHLVAQGRAAVTETLEHAAAVLALDQADAVCIIAFEAVHPPSCPDHLTLQNGAIALIAVAPGRLPQPAIGQVDLDRAAAPAGHGSVEQLLAILATL
jgi:hypothetical protein